jgi:hypothetical protein
MEIKLRMYLASAVIFAGSIFAFAACGEDKTGDPVLTNGTSAVEQLTAECHGKVQAFSDRGRGVYGRTSSWIGICADGHVVEVQE